MKCHQKSVNTYVKKKIASELTLLELWRLTWLCGHTMSLLGPAGINVALHM